MSSVRHQILQDHPIWITGMGAVSAAGFGVDQLWNASLVGSRNREWVDFGEQGRYLVAPVRGLEEHQSPIASLRKLDRSARLAHIAVNEALAQAGIAEGHGRIGVAVGSSRGPFLKQLEAISALKKERVRPLLAATSTIASLSGSIAQHWKLDGPTLTVSSACASGAHALAVAADKILLGDADIMIAGGTEACLHPAIMAPLRAAGVLGENQNDELVCQPFDAARNGILLGEGAGFLVLESAKSARARGVSPLASLGGWSCGSDSFGRTNVDPTGIPLFRTMSKALETSHQKKVEYVNAHGTGTIQNDLAEARAIARLSSHQDFSISVSSTKPITGHCLGATAALEAIIAISSLQKQIVPPTTGCLTKDQDCKVDVVVKGPRSQEINATISNSLGFWSHFASLLFEKEV